MSIEVIKPGLLSTFQDLGRQGFQHLGVPLNGAMDEQSHRLANWLVGNPAQTATLEITLMGPTLVFHVAAVIALCGADLSAHINGTPVALNTALLVPAGSTLSFGPRQSGLRTYLAIQHGFAIEPVMGSCSTHLRGHYGGFQGTALRKQQVLPLPASTPIFPVRACAIPPIFATKKSASAPIRLVAGREASSFTADSRQALVTEGYTITPQSDRMGYRLSGPALTRTEPRELLSEAVTAGTVQVPPDGQPIILMADAQTTGGYPRIANVIWADLPRLAQKAPGEHLRFEWVSLDNAQQLAIKQANIFAAMEAST